jgi:transposase
MSDTGFLELKQGMVSRSGGFVMDTDILGIDISKNSFEVCLLRGAQKKPPQATFSNDLSGFSKLSAWLGHRNALHTHAVMESTGTYGEELALFLGDCGHLVSIVNPARIKAYGQSELLRNKTDKADAALIARFAQAQPPEPWTPPSPEMRTLRGLVRHLENLKNDKARQENRLSVPHLPREVADSLRQVMATLEAEIRSIEDRIRTHVGQNPDLQKKQDLLTSIPGVGDTTAHSVMAEIPSLEFFSSARDLAAYAGISPMQRQSGTSVRGRTRLSKKGNGRLRKALYFPAITASRFNPHLIIFATRLQGNGKPPKAVVGAVMRQLLHQIYGVLTSGQPYDPHYIPPQFPKGGIPVFQTSTA